MLDDPSAPDLLSIGTRCATCSTADFLPWTCPGCSRSFCADHRAPAAHACPRPVPRAGAGRVVVPCPVCASGVELPTGVDLKDDAGVAVIVDAHMRSPACDPANYARVHAKPRCPVPGCKATLSLVNAFDCRACGGRVCLKHRHATDHACGGVVTKTAGAKPAARPGIAAAFRSMREALQRSGSGGGGGGVAGAAGPPPTSAAAAAAAAAARRLTGGGGPAVTTAATTALSPRSAAAAAAHRRAAAAASTCPVCGLACATHKAVRAHHAAAHPGATPLPPAGCAMS